MSEAAANRKPRPNTGICVCCGNPFDYVWTRNHTCSDPCGAKFKHWRSQGAKRIRARISTHQAHIAELQRILEAVEASPSAHQESPRP